MQKACDLSRLTPIIKTVSLAKRLFPPLKIKLKLNYLNLEPEMRVYAHRKERHRHCYRRQRGNRHERLHLELRCNR